MNVGDYIKQLRLSRGYSQEQLGKLVGVQRAAVQKWECGKVQNLKRETIKRLAELFDVSPSSFIVSEEQERSLEQEELFEAFSSLSEEDQKKAIEYIKLLKKAAE